MGAHVNRTGNTVQIYLVADGADFPTVGPGLSGAYPRKEGAFFGNIFKSPPELYYCASPAAQTNPILGRIGSTFVSPQYANPYASGTGLCGGNCTDLGGGDSASGWTSCRMPGQPAEEPDRWMHVMNVWTQ
ncbi:MAG TPA: hypothetical protein PKA58_24680, partial [Polyangium sp.]|nr:hypothetical protein [Polyangium sp.]